MTLTSASFTRIYDQARKTGPQTHDIFTEDLADKTIPDMFTTTSIDPHV
jgi:hypothetical protein